MLVLVLVDNIDGEFDGASDAQGRKSISIFENISLEGENPPVHDSSFPSSSMQHLFIGTTSSDCSGPDQLRISSAPP